MSGPSCDREPKKWRWMALSNFFFSSENILRPGLYVLWKPSELPILFAQTPGNVSNRLQTMGGNLCSAQSQNKSEVRLGGWTMLPFFFAEQTGKHFFLCYRSRLDSESFYGN